MKIMQTRYFDLSTEQKLSISNEDFAVSIRLEAVWRGIKPPLALDEAIIRKEWVGFQQSPQAVAFYEIYAPATYGGHKATGIGFHSEAEAWNACKGAFGIQTESYGDPKTTILSGDFQVRSTWLTTTKAKSVSAPIEEYFQEDKDFDALCEECTKDLSIVRQSDYNQRVLKAKRKSYMELAQGNEEIAKAFWAKTEGGEFPAE